MRDPNHRNKNARKELMVTGVPHSLRAALLGDAKERGLPINEVAARILAERYNVKWTPMNGHGPVERNPDSERLSIRGGAKLHKKISLDAVRRDGTLRGVVLECLCLHYNLPLEPIGRRPRKEVPA